MNSEEKQTDNQTAQDVLEAIDARIAAIKARRQKLPGEMAEHRHALGAALMGKAGTAKIHSAIDRLRVETIELDVELEALEPVRVRTLEAIKQAEKQAAANLHTELLRGTESRSILVFNLLDRVHLELCELRQVQDRMHELQEAAGGLVPPPDSRSISVPVAAIWDEIFRAIDRIVFWNGQENLTRGGARVPADYNAEFSGQSPLPERRSMPAIAGELEF